MEGVVSPSSIPSPNPSSPSLPLSLDPAKRSTNHQLCQSCSVLWFLLQPSRLSPIFFFFMSSFSILQWVRGSPPMSEKCRTRCDCSTPTWIDVACPFFVGFLLSARINKAVAKSRGMAQGTPILCPSPGPAAGRHGAAAADWSQMKSTLGEKNSKVKET